MPQRYRGNKLDGGSVMLQQRSVRATDRGDVTATGLCLLLKRDKYIYRAGRKNLLILKRVQSILRFAYVLIFILALNTSQHRAIDRSVLRTFSLLS